MFFFYSLSACTNYKRTARVSLKIKTGNEKFIQEYITVSAVIVRRLKKKEISIEGVM